MGVAAKAGLAWKQTKSEWLLVNERPGSREEFSFNWWWAKLVDNKFCESGDPGLDIISCPSAAILVCPNLKGPGHHEPARPVCWTGQ